MNFFLLLFITGMAPPLAHADSSPLSPIVGKLGMIRGEVWLDHHPVKSGIEVREGAVIEVKVGANATLLLGQGSVIQLSADSKIVVHHFGVTPATQEEAGELELKFGKSRGLFLNEDQSKKKIMIRTRAATLGVRGTEVWIDVPKDESKSVQFFTIEGKAELTIPGAVQPKMIPQGEGALVGAKNGAGQNGGIAASVQSLAKSASEVKAQAQSAGLAAPVIRNPTEAAAVAAGGLPNQPPPAQLPNGPTIGSGFLSDQFGSGTLTNVNLDPVADGGTRVTIKPTFQGVSP